MSKSLIATVSAVLAIAASLPVGAAKALPAQNGGGCNMVWHLSQPGGEHDGRQRPWHRTGRGEHVRPARQLLGRPLRSRRLGGEGDVRLTGDRITCSIDADVGTRARRSERSQR